MVQYIIGEKGNDDPDWFFPREPTPINEDEEKERLLAITDNIRFDLEKESPNRRIVERSRDMTKYERKLQAMEEIKLAMKSSAPGVHQDALNGNDHAYQVFEYLEQIYAPSKTFRIQDATRQISWLERADYFQKGIEHWLLTWKDVYKKLIDMGLPIEGDRLRQRLKKTNARIAPETSTFLHPKSLTDEVTLDHTVGEALTFYRLNPSPKSRQLLQQQQRSFAAFKGRGQNGSKETYRCLESEEYGGGILDPGKADILSSVSPSPNPSLY